MILKKWDNLPLCFKTDEIKPYYEFLYKKRKSIFFKRVFDFIFGIFLFIITLPILLIIGLIIKIDSPGPIFFRQIRVTQYGENFKIMKLRTMKNGSELNGSPITLKNDNRITKVGAFLRKLRIDELPQLLNIIKGEMTFVGMRPELPKYVESYTNEMLATLLMPAGVTSFTSIKYRNEYEMLVEEKSSDNFYINNILPDKMKSNLEELKQFSLWKDLNVIFSTIKMVLIK